MPKPTYAELARRVRSLTSDLEKAQHQAPEQTLTDPQGPWQTTLRSIFKAVPTGIGMAINRVILQANDLLCEMTGYSRDELIGRSARMLYPTDEAYDQVGREKYHQIWEKGIGSVETRWRCKDGTSLDILLSSAPLNSADQSQGVIFTALDITARKGFESELRRSERRFRALAELLPQTVYEMGLDGRLTFVNNNAYKMFGYTVKEFERGLSALDMIVPEERERALSAIMAIIEGGIGHKGWHFTARRRDGSTFPVLIYSTVIAEEGGPKGLRGIIVDISEHERLVEEKDRLEAQYIQSQKMEAVGRLAGGVAHDLNNMLTPIVGYSEVLLGDMPAEAPDREMVDQILSAALRAKDMVQQLLAFSRRQTLEIKPVSLNQILAGFESLLDRILRDDVQLELKLSRGVPNILADAGKIEQVIMNLAVNAQDAMPDGGKITIEVNVVELGAESSEALQLATPGPYVLLSFGDSGHGMNTETKARIFDPFFTTKVQGKGTGLGLATVYGIVKQHNGAIQVESEPGMGAVFKTYFPAAPGLELPEGAGPAQAGNPRGTESVLIVEDNAAVRKLAENILKQYGYQTDSATGGEACQALLTQGRKFDLLLTDVILEDTNGKELYYLVKQHIPQIKVLYMSGYTDDVIVDHGVLESGIAFIQKPFMLGELLKKVRQVLDGPKSI
jgi:PAS domain S-box-containing protein